MLGLWIIQCLFSLALQCGSCIVADMAASRHLINYARVTFPTQAEADAYNLKAAQKVARACSTLEEVEDLALELSLCLCDRDYIRFKQIAVDAWFDWNVNKICNEVGNALSRL